MMRGCKLDDSAFPGKGLSYFQGMVYGLLVTSHQKDRLVIFLLLAFTAHLRILFIYFAEYFSNKNKC